MESLIRPFNLHTRCEGGKLASTGLGVQDLGNESEASFKSGQSRSVAAWLCKIVRKLYNYDAHTARFFEF